MTTRSEELLAKFLEDPQTLVASAEAYQAIGTAEAENAKSEQDFEKGRALLNEALVFGKSDHSLILHVAEALEWNRLIQPKLELDGELFNWIELFELSAKVARKNGDEQFRSKIQERLSGLLVASRHTDDFFYISRYEKITSYWSGFSVSSTTTKLSDNILHRLLQLHSWAHLTYKDNQTVPVGEFSDIFPTSRRSVSRAVWLAIQSRVFDGTLDRFLKKQEHRGLLKSAANEEIKTLEAAGMKGSEKHIELTEFLTDGNFGYFATSFCKNLT